MDPIAIATLVFKGVQQLLKAAKGAGLIDEDPSVYIDAAIDYAKRGGEILLAKLSGSTDYDSLTAEELEAQLWPADIDKIEAAAKARIADGQ